MVKQNGAPELSPEELADIHTAEIDALDTLSQEDLSEEDLQVLNELNQEEAKRREQDGTLAYRAQQLASRAVEAAVDEHNTGADNSWSRSSGGEN